MTPATTPSPRISEEEYLRREREREEKYEFENGKEIPVGGATKEYNRIVRNLLTFIWAQLRALEKFEAYAN